MFSQFPLEKAKVVFLITLLSWGNQLAFTSGAKIRLHLENSYIFLTFSNIGHMMITLVMTTGKLGSALSSY